MAKKIEIINNSLVITNTVTSKIVGEFPKRDVFFDNAQLELAVDPNVTFYDTNSVNATGSVLWEAELVDCVDSGLVPFTAASLRAFARVSLGFNIAPVPPPAAQTLQDVSTLGSTAAIATAFTVSVNQGLDDVSFLNLDGIGFGVGGTSIGFDDTLNGGGIQSIEMEGSLGNFISGGIQVTDASTNKGLFYAADYSANYSIRSLVDKGYVDVASTPQDLTSVLLAGNDVGANPLNVPSSSGGITFGGFSFARIQAAPNGGIGIGTQDGGDLSLIPGLSSDMNLHLQPTATGKISIGRVVFGGYGIGITDTILSFSDEVGFKGFVYTADYSAAGILDDLWIPNYGAVKAAIPKIGTAPVSVTSVVSSGTATAGFLTSTNNMVEYEIGGVGNGAIKILYYSVIVPEDYKSGGTININSWTTDFLNLTTWTVTGYINGVVDTVLSAVSITPTADLAYELTSNNFADLISAGDVLQIKLDFTGSIGDDIRVNKVNFTYNR